MKCCRYFDVAAGWRSLVSLGWAIGFGFSLVPGLFAAETAPVEQLLNDAQAAQRQGKFGEALILANSAIKSARTNAQAFYVRGRLYAEDREPAKAVEDFTQALTLEPRGAELYQFRGFEQFKLGRFQESCADFDKFLQFVPQRAPYHWQRGISCYYAGRYDEGRKQFELHRTVNADDVENSAWHFFCVARSAGLAQARASLLPTTGDSRVPMMQIHAMLAGKAKPDDVLEAAAKSSSTSQRDQQLFYANLYVGLYYEVSGNAKLARKHIDLAAQEYRSNDYMGEVARVHSELFKKSAR
jgi:lipoprotein NlpI